MSSKQDIKVSSIKKRATWIKEVSAYTAEEALQHLDDMGHSCFDMCVIEMTTYEDSLQVRLKVLAWENDQTREIYSV